MTNGCGRSPSYSGSLKATARRRSRFGRLSTSAEPRRGSGSISAFCAGPSLDRRDVVVFAFVGSLRQLDLVVRDLFVRNHRQDMGDAIEPAATLVVGALDMPGRMLDVGGFEHQVPRLGVVVPASIRFQIHRA